MAVDEESPLLGGPKAPRCETPPPPPPQREAFGFFVLGLSSVGVSAMTFVVHVLGAPSFGFRTDAVFLVWARSLFQLVCAAVGLCLCARVAGPLPRPNRRVLGLLVARGLCGASAFLCFYRALALLPLGDMVTIFFMSPLLTALLTHVSLRETVTRFEAAMSLLSFAGVALVALPARGEQEALAEPHARAFGVVLAFGAALFSAFAYTLVRRMGTSVHFLMNVASLGLCGTLIASVILRAHIVQCLADAFARPDEGALILLQCVFAFFGQCCLNLGLQHSRGLGVMIRNVDVPIAYLLGICFLGELPSWISSFGAALVLTATSGITFQKAVLK